MKTLFPLFDAKTTGILFSIALQRRTATMLSDAVVSASTDPEAFGRVMIEAQALGRPVIASDHGGALETVLPKKTGWLVPPGDVDALSDALIEVLDLDEVARGRFTATKKIVCRHGTVRRSGTGTHTTHDFRRGDRLLGPRVFTL